MIFVTPEYNRSVPGGVEERARQCVASLRPKRMGGKAVGVIGVVVGAAGAALWRSSTCNIAYLDMPTGGLHPVEGSDEMADRRTEPQVCRLDGQICRLGEVAREFRFIALMPGPSWHDIPGAPRIRSFCRAPNPPHGQLQTTQLVRCFAIGDEDMATIGIKGGGRTRACWRARRSQSCLADATPSQAIRRRWRDRDDAPAARLIRQAGHHASPATTTYLLLSGQRAGDRRYAG